MSLPRCWPVRLGVSICVPNQMYNDGQINNKTKSHMLKRLLTYALVVSTAVWSVGLLATPLAVGAAVSGDLIKLQCTAGASVNDPCKAVYYLGADSKRYVFPNEKTYKTWYSDFSGVKVVSSTEMSSYAIGGNVTYRPGVKLVKITTDPKVYAVAMDGTLRWVTTADIAAALYGSNWATMVEDVPDAFFVNYTVGANITAASDYSVQGAKDGSPTINEDKGLSGTVPSGASVSVALASDTPATGIVAENAARVPFTKVNLTASADGDVVVDSWQVERIGLGQNGAFASVDILDAATMLPINSTGKTLNAQNIATFSENFVIPAGQTRSVILAGNMAASLDAYAGEIPSLSLKSITMQGNTTVMGSLPVTGNYQNLNATITIGTATVQRGAYSNATSTALEVGKTNYAFFAFSIQAGSTEDVSFNQVRLYQSGSASLGSDLDNLKLYRDGTLLATGVVDGNYVSFSFSGITIPEGQTYQFQVKGDVVGGSARTIQLSVYRTTDLLVKGLEFGYNITPSYSGTGSSGSNPVLTDNQATISTGTLRVGRSNTVAAGNIGVGNDQVLGAFEFEAKGEPVNITALTLTVTSSTTGTITEDALQSVKLVDANGVTVAGPTDITNNALTVAWTDTFTVPIGVNHYRVVGNLALTGGWSSDDTIYVSMNPGSVITARGETTDQTITATPSSSVSASTQTIKAASLTVSKHSKATARNIITNSQNVLANSWVFDASAAGEDIRVTSIAVRASTTGKVNALTLREGAATECAGAIINPINDAPVSSNDSTATSTFALTEPLIITKGTSKTVDLCVNIGSDTNAGEVNTFGITSTDAITAYGKTTGNSASKTVTAHDGPALTAVAAGTLEITLDASAPASQRVVAGTTGAVLSEIRLEATNEAIDITQLVVTIADGDLTGTAAGDYTQVGKFYLKLDGQVIGNAAGYVPSAASTTISLNRGDLTIPAGSEGKKLTITGDLASIGTNLPGTANADIKVGIGATGGANITAYGNGSNGSATKTYNSSTGSPMILHKAIPQVVIETPTNDLAASAVLSRVKITAVGGKIGIHRLSFVTNTSTSVTLSNGYYRLAACGGCDGIAAGEVLSSTTSAGTYLIDGSSTWSNTITSGSHGKSYLGIASGATATIDFYATVGMTTNSDSVSTSLLGDTATTTNDTGGDPAAAFASKNQGNFVWSDLNLDNSNSAAALTSKQWYNGYYVTGLGPNTTTTPVTVGE